MNKQLSFLSEISLPSYPLTLLSSCKRSAFTLAETLIVLAIIGIVAVLTLPTFIDNYQEKVLANKLKKVYSNLSNVYNLAYVEKGSPEDYIIDNDEAPNWYSRKSHVVFRNYFKDYFNTARIGNLSYENNDGVYYTDLKKNNKYNLSDSNSFASFVSNDGNLYVFRYLNSSAGGFVDTGRKSLGVIFVFLNYRKNTIGQLGRNVFLFSIYENDRKIYPGGFSTVGQEPLMCYSNLYACAQWVLQKENMDYLHCDGLSWKGKTKCK